MTVPVIAVLGSVNMDLVYRVRTIPRPGETVLGEGPQLIPGGKGANQAVGAVRLGAPTTFIGRLGSDSYGDVLLERLREEGIDTRHVRRVDGPSGTAVIAVDDRGENSIVVSPSANYTFETTDLDEIMPAMEEARFLLMQFEIPVDVVVEAAGRARAAGTKVIVDAGGISPDDAEVVGELLENVYVFSPNASELETVSGMDVENDDDLLAAAEEVLERGAQVVICKLGARGALLLHAGETAYIPTFEVEAVDTTAAGDAFTAALAVGLAEGMELRDAVSFANAAGAVSVTRLGAQPSLPARDEVEALCRA